MKTSGRNERCSCGSGRRYKHCHGAFPSPWNDALERGFQAGLARHEAEQARRLHQQGQGKPIISAKLNDVQMVAVGDVLRWGKWKTFEDFLDDNLKRAFGEAWAHAELSKPDAERHPLFNWIDEFAKQMDSAPVTSEGIKTMRSVGAHAAYFGLAYNLYLLQHNVELTTLLLARLRLKSEFHSAYYETCVAATFILAGFKLALEDERDGGSTHCEFFATVPDSGRTFWVEAKAREPGKPHMDVGNQIYKALKKETQAERIVLIDLNVPDIDLNDSVAGELQKLVRGREEKMTIAGKPAPAAFIFVTNFSAHLDLDLSPPRRMIVPLGFKQPDFGVEVGFPTVELAFKAKQRHLPLYRFMEHYKAYSIPSTFDGELPQFSFGMAERRWTIGQIYTLDGIDQPCVLEAGFVAPKDREATLVFRAGEEFLHLREPLSDAEIDAYNAHPETFFGVLDRNARTQQPESQLEWFEFAYESYKDTPKETLLEFMSDAPDIEELRNLDQKELAIRYCGGFARGASSGGR